MNQVVLMNLFRNKSFYENVDLINYYYKNSSDSVNINYIKSIEKEYRLVKNDKKIRPFVVYSFNNNKSYPIQSILKNKNVYGWRLHACYSCVKNVCGHLYIIMYWPSPLPKINPVIKHKTQINYIIKNQ